MRWEPLVHHQMRESYVEKGLVLHDMQPTSRAAEQHVRTEADPTTPPPSAIICGGLLGNLAKIPPLLFGKVTSSIPKEGIWKHPDFHGLLSSAKTKLLA